MRPGDDIDGIELWGRCTQNAPLIDCSDFYVAGARLLEFRRVRFAGQIRIAKALVRSKALNLPIADGKVFGLGFKGGGGGVYQDLSCGGAGTANGGDCRGRGAAAGRASVVWDELGIGEDDIDMAERDVEFFGGGLGEFGSGALAYFDFAGEERDGAVGRQVKAFGGAGAASVARALSEEGGAGS